MTRLRSQANERAAAGQARLRSRANERASARHAAAAAQPSRELQTLKAEFFRALAHPVRIRLLELLAASGAHTVQALQQRLGIDQPIVSQQLARLRASGIVTATKEATSVTYALADPLIADLLRVAKEILNRQLVGAHALLKELRRDRR